MLKLNEDAVHLIAQHIPPNPVIYTRLASVSRTFHSVFTSDTCWSRINPYYLDCNIFRHFIDTTSSNPREFKLMKVFWHSSIVRWLSSSISLLTSNEYIWLGELAKSPVMIQFESLGDKKHLILALLLNAPHKSYNLKDTMFDDHEELVWTALKNGNLVSKSTMDKHFSVEKLEHVLFSNPAAAGDIFSLYPELMVDPKFLKIALRNPQSLEQFPDFVLKQLSRSQVLSVISEAPFLLRFGYRDDEEVALQAAKNRLNFKLSDVSEQLRDKFEIALLGVKAESCEYSILSDGLRQNQKIIDAAANTIFYGRNQIEIKREDIVAQRELAKAWFLADGERIFEYPEYLDDKELVLLAVKTCPWRIEEINPLWQRDATIKAIPGREFSITVPLDDEILNLCLQHDWSLEIVPQHLITKELLLKSPQLMRLMMFPDKWMEFHDDFDIARAAARKYGESALFGMSSRLAQDPRIWANILEFKLDQKTMFHVMATDSALQLLPVELYEHEVLKGLIRQLVSKAGTKVEKLLESDDELALISVATNEVTYTHLPQRLKLDIEFTKLAVSKNGGIYRYLEPDMLMRPEVIESIGNMQPIPFEIHYREY